MDANPRRDTDWTLVATDEPGEVILRPGSNLVAPVPRHPRHVPLCLRGLLPIHNHNRALVELLDACPAGMFTGCTVVAGIFGADSFLPFTDMMRAFERLGIGAVSNFPAIAAYGALIGATLSDVGLGFERERQTLARFREHGFETAMVIRTAEHKAAAEKDGCFALIELAQSDTQVFSKLFGQKSTVLRLFMTPDGTAPKSGRPPDVDGLIVSG